jgi:Flp pilus assembly protein CpaB
LIPDNPIAWIILLIAAVIGYLMGQWMKARRRKADGGQIAAEQMRKELAVAARRAQKGKNKKKIRKAARKSGEI